MLALVVGLALLATGCDWLQYGYGGGGSFANPTETAFTRLTVGSLHETAAIALPTGHVGDPIVFLGTIVTTSLDGGTATVSAFQATTGAPVWSVTLPGAASAVTAPAADRTHVLVGVSDGSGSRVFALGPSDGAVAWTSSALPASPVTQVLVTKGRVIVAYGSGQRTAALTATDGSVLWDLAGVGQSTDLVTGSGYLTRMWPVTLTIPNNPPITVDSGEVIDTADGATVSSFDGVKLASNPQGPGFLSYVAATADRVVTRFSGRGFPITSLFDPADPNGGVGFPAFGPVDAVSPSVVVQGEGPWDVYRTSTGEQRFEIPAPDGMVGSGNATIAGGDVIFVPVVTADGSSLRAYDVSTGDALATIPVTLGSVSSATHVLVANGSVYVTDGDALRILTLP